MNEKQAHGYIGYVMGDTDDFEAVVIDKSPVIRESEAAARADAMALMNANDFDGPMWVEVKTDRPQF